MSATPQIPSREAASQIPGREAASQTPSREAPSQTPSRDVVAPEPPWLVTAALLADMAFETDREGRFTLFGTGIALGYRTSQLVGTEIVALLAASTSPGAASLADTAAQFSAVFGAICAECLAWQGKVRLRQMNGQSRLYRLALAPRIIPGGGIAGTYGLLFELETPDGALPVPGADPDPVAAILDAETGLWRAKIFMTEMARRFDRLDVERMPGTLLCLGFSRATDYLHGAIAMRLTDELRDIVRPTDLLGRIDETTIALWCDGMDNLTGGERATKFCSQLPNVLPGRMTVTVGVVTRWPGMADDAQTVLERGRIALKLADTAFAAPGHDGIGAWHVWQPE